MQHCLKCSFLANPSSFHRCSAPCNRLKDSTMKGRSFNSSKRWCQGFFSSKACTDALNPLEQLWLEKATLWFAAKILWLSVTSVMSPHCQMLPRELQWKSTGQSLNNFTDQLGFNLLIVNTSYKVKNNRRRKLFSKNVTYATGVSPSEVVLGRNMPNGKGNYMPRGRDSEDEAKSESVFCGNVVEVGGENIQASFQGQFVGLTAN